MGILTIFIKIEQIPKNQFGEIIMRQKLKDQHIV